MKKYINKKTYAFIALFFFLCYFAYTKKSYIIDELFATNEAIATTQIDIKIAEKKLATAKTTIENIKKENAQNIKDKIDINVIKTKIKRQIKAYNLLNQTIKINLNDIKEQSKYLDAFVAEFELINAGADTRQIATTLDFLGLYGVVESYKNNKAVVYINLKNEHPKPNGSVASSMTPSKKVPQGTITQPINKANIDEAKNSLPKSNGSVTKIPQKIKTQSANFKADTIVLDIEKNKPTLVKLAQNLTKKTLDNDFEKRFLEANQERFTINLFSSATFQQSFDLLQKYKLVNNAIIFSFRETNILYKTMYGIYDTKEKAQEAINTLPQELKLNNPRTEKISIKQDLYKKYHTPALEQTQSVRKSTKEEEEK